PAADGDVVIEDGRIAEVGPGLDGDESVDVGGKTLIPGLFDCHTHVMISDIDMWKMSQRPFSLMFYEPMHNLRANLDIGITTGGVLSPSDDPRHAHFTMDELTMLVQEAAAAGRWVMAHAQGSTGIKNGIKAGIRSIDHGIYLDDEAIDLMLQRGTYLVPTLV